MQAAALMASRGNRVSILEKNTELGGQWNIAAATPHKNGYATFTEHLKRALDSSGVSTMLGTVATKEHVLSMRPDVVVLATGAVPLQLDVPGARAEHVVQANDVLTGSVQPTGKVVVIGGRLLSMEVAIFLAEKGVEVSLISRSRLGGRKGPDEKITFRTLLRRLMELRVPLYPNTGVREIMEDSVITDMGDEIVSLPADTVVVAIGVQPVDTLSQELHGLVPEIYTIGDCKLPGNAAQATSTAARLAAKI
jgi:pyruvate/2-oxoglutarate dehydrogenase complex dihydrolipoamide dehydrogenase (E3) component